MRSINLSFLCSVLCLSWNAAAWDYNFSVVGESGDAPAELTVFRRAKGYAISVRHGDSKRKIVVYFDCDNSRKTGDPHGALGAEYRLNDDGSVEKYSIGKWLEAGRALVISALPEVHGYYVSDEILGISAENQVGIACRFHDSKRYLPDETNGPLLVSGKQILENTILRQIDNAKVAFEDPEGDIVQAGCDDFISGSAEVKDGQLILVCRAAAEFKNKLRIWIDSIPGAGYGPIEADYLIDGRELLRYSGGDTKKWSWEKLVRLEPETGGNGAEIRYSVPLDKIRPHKYGRLRVCFQAAPYAETGDMMPDRGKVVPVLRPGNLASAPDTKVEVSSLYPKYKAYPLTDGQTSGRIYYSYAAWASADLPGQEQFADFLFKKEEPVRHIAVWWEIPPREIEILARQGEEWKLLSKTTIPEKEMQTNISLPENSRAEAIRVRMPAGQGNKSRPNLLWIREVEIY